MATLVYALNQSLDGFVDHDRMAPDPVLFAHHTEDMRATTALLYGRVMYGLMRYWDQDQDGWTPEHHAYAHAWRSTPKWVVSRGNPALGPNATALDGDLHTAVRGLLEAHQGTIGLAGPGIADTLLHLGLVDVVKLWVHPTVLGQGTPCFRRPPPTMALIATEQIGTTAMLTYARRPPGSH